jgi:beta-lactamase class A
MKICVLMELFHQVECGEARLDEEIEIHNSFKSLVDGTPFSTGGEDDSEQSLYERLGERENLLALAKPMITHSSNLATNLLIERLGAPCVHQFMHDLGAPGISVLRGVEDGKAFRQGLNNTASARGMATIMSKLAKGEVVSPPASSRMIDILASQTHCSAVPAGVPEGAKVANKPGWNSEACHDVAIVFPPNRDPYVLAVMTNGIEDKPTAHRLIAAISSLVWSANGASP